VDITYDVADADGERLRMSVALGHNKGRVDS
jgi:hypothetical protein